MNILNSLKQNLVFGIMYFIINNVISSSGSLISGRPVEETSCQDACGKSSLNSLNELKLDLKFANDLIREGNSKDLVEKKIHELESNLLEQELGFDRTGSSILDSTGHLMNLFSKQDRLAGCKNVELSQMLACLTETLIDDITSIREKNDLILQYVSLETNYTKALDNFYSKLDTLRYLIESGFEDLVENYSGIVRDYYNLDYYYRQNYKNPNQYINLVIFNRVYGSFAEQLECGKRIKEDLKEIEKTNAKLAKKMLKAKNDNQPLIKSIQEFISQSKVEEHRVYDQVRHANDIIVGPLLKFSREDNLAGAGEFLDRSGLDKNFNRLLDMSLISEESVIKAQLKANETEKLILNLKMEELTKSLEGKIADAKLMINRLL